MRRVALRREKLDGDFGDEGLEEKLNNPELLLFGCFFGVAVVLHRSLGVFGMEEVGVVAAFAVVRHRRREVETDCVCNRGVEGLELVKNPNLAPNLGVLVSPPLCFCCSCFLSAATVVVSRFLGIDVQKALLQPVTISQSVHTECCTKRRKEVDKYEWRWRWRNFFLKPRKLLFASRNK